MLEPEALTSVALGKISNRLFENHRVTLTYDDELVKEVGKRCTEVESGARNVDNILTNTLLPELSRQLLGGMAERERVSAIRVSVGVDGNFAYEVAGAQAKTAALSAA